MQGVGSLPAMQWRASAAKVCTSEARKMRVPLGARQERSSSGRFGFLGMRGARKTHSGALRGVPAEGVAKDGRSCPARRQGEASPVSRL